MCTCNSCCYQCGACSGLHQGRRSWCSGNAHCAQTAPQLLGNLWPSEPHHGTFQAKVMCFCLIGALGDDVCGVNAVVHQGGLCGREDKAHWAHVVPRRAAAWPHHGLLRHRRQAKGAGLSSAPSASIIMKPQACAGWLSPRAQPHQRQCLQLAEPKRLRSLANIFKGHVCILHRHKLTVPDSRLHGLPVWHKAST